MKLKIVWRASVIIFQYSLKYPLVCSTTYIGRDIFHCFEKFYLGQILRQMRPLYGSLIEKLCPSLTFMCKYDCVQLAAAWKNFLCQKWHALQHCNGYVLEYYVNDECGITYFLQLVTKFSTATKVVTEGCVYV